MRDRALAFYIDQGWLQKLNQLRKIHMQTVLSLRILAYVFKYKMPSKEFSFLNEYNVFLLGVDEEIAKKEE